MCRLVVLEIAGKLINSVKRLFGKGCVQKCLPKNAGKSKTMPLVSIWQRCSSDFFAMKRPNRKTFSAPVRVVTGMSFLDRPVSH